MFSHEAYEEIVKQTIDQIHSLSKLKGGEYAGDYDRLANFRRNAAALGLSMEQVWAVYAAKHWDAVQTYVKDIATGTDRVRLEGLEGRADDLIVYLILFKAILQERNDSQAKQANQSTNPLRPMSKENWEIVQRQLEDSKMLASRVTPDSFKFPQHGFKEGRIER